MNFRKITAVILSLTLLILLNLCGCSREESQLEVSYGGRTYSTISNWYPINDDYKSITVKMDDSDCKANLYSLSGRNVIKIEGDLAGEIYFFPKNEELPNYKNIDNVDKIVISEFSKDENVIKDNSGIKKWLNIISTAETSSSKDDVIGSVNIYYRDFPVYQYLGNLCKNKNGKYTIALN